MPVTVIFRERTQAGNGHDCFQSRSPWTAPLKEGATIHHLKVVCCALPGASCGKRMIARSVPAPVNHHRGSYTSPALADASYPFVYLPPGNTLHCKLFPSSKFTILLFPKVAGHSIIELATNRTFMEVIRMFQELGISAGTAIIILIALYFIIKWSVKNGIKEAYKDITGKKLTEDLELETLLEENVDNK